MMKKEIVMRQFSLEEFLDNPNQKIVTRGGNPVRIICTNADSERCVIGLVRLSTKEEVAISYYANGTRWTDSDSGHDLFFITEKEECPFKEGDKVLVRDANTFWCFDKFRFYNEGEYYPYVCLFGTYKQCIPLNEHTWQLLGTIDEYKEE